MPKENVAGFSLRLNLDNEQHMRIYKVLHDLNVDIHKSKNQFMVEALDFYIRSFEEEKLVKNATIAQAKKQGWISRDDFENFKAEIKIEIRNEMIQLLGSMIVGKQFNVAQTVTEVSTATQSKKAERADEDEIVGMTDPEAISLISSWG
ncbi:MAG: hypothetical protein ACYDEX_08570 [Mobilitalea sp.]